MPGPGRAGRDAGRLALGFGQGRIVDAVHAQGALAHGVLDRIDLAGAVGAGPGAQVAADADVGIDQHDAILGALEAGPGRADGDAGRRLAVQAGAGEVDAACLFPFTAGLIAVYPIEPDAQRLSLIGIDVGQGRRPALVVPLLAGDRAGLAAHAGV